MYPAEGFFYISEAELMRLSYQPRFAGKPLAFVFLQFLKQNNLANSFEISKVGNFFNRLSTDNFLFEILFNDASSFVIGKGEIKIFHPISGYFESFCIDCIYSQS